jgi:hypothetical protein
MKLLKNIVPILTVCCVLACKNNTNEQILTCQESHLSSNVNTHYNPFLEKVDTSKGEFYSASNGGEIGTTIIFKKEDSVISKIIDCRQILRVNGLITVFAAQQVTLKEWNDIVSKFKNSNFWCIKQKSIDPRHRIYDGGGYGLSANTGQFQHHLFVMNERSFDDFIEKAIDDIQGSKQTIKVLVDDLLKTSYPILDSIKSPLITFESKHYHSANKIKQEKDPLEQLRLLMQNNGRIYKIKPAQPDSIKSFKVFLNGQELRAKNNVFEIETSREAADRQNVYSLTLTNKNEKIYQRLWLNQGER